MESSCKAKMVVEFIGEKWFVVSASGKHKLSLGYPSFSSATTVLDTFAVKRLLIIELLKKAKMKHFSDRRLNVEFKGIPHSDFTRRLFFRFLKSGVILESDFLMSE